MWQSWHGAFTKIVVPACHHRLFLEAIPAPSLPIGDSNAVSLLVRRLRLHVTTAYAYACAYAYDCAYAYAYAYEYAYVYAYAYAYVYACAYACLSGWQEHDIDALAGTVCIPFSADQQP